MNITIRFWQGALTAMLMWSMRPYAVGQTAPRSASETPLRRQIQSDWLHLRALDEECKTYIVRNTATLKKPDGTTTSTEGRVIVRVDWRSGFRYLETTDAAENSVSVYSRNPAYAFVVGKDALGGRWRLHGFDRAPEAENPVDQLVSSGPNRTLFYPLTTTIWENTSLDALLSRSDFQIHDIKSLPSDRNLIRFTYRQASHDSKAPWEYKGTLRVNRRLFNAVEEWDVSVARIPGSQRQDSSAEFRLVRSYEMTPSEAQSVACRRITQTTPGGTQIWSFSDYERGAVPTDPFWLRYYGLPEPVDLPVPGLSISLYAWLLAIALACASMAVVIRRLSSVLSRKPA